MTRLSDVVDMTFGFAFRSAEFSEEPADVRLLRGDNIGQGRLRWGGAKRFPRTRVGEFERYQLAVGDAVIAMDRPWIEAGLKYSVVREEDVPSLLVQRVARLRTKSDSLDQGFLGAVIGSAEFTNYVIGVQTGSAVPHISGGQIGDFEFELPDVGEQRAITATLGALDDKIESNRHAADTLVALISALFEQVISSREVVYAPLGELARAVNGRSYKSSELQESSTALVTLKSVDRNGGYKESGLKPYTGPHKPEQEVRPGEIVVAQTDLTQGAEIVGRGVRVPRSGRYDTLVASLDLAIVRPLAGMPVEYLHGLLSSEAFRQHCRAHVTGTTVLHLAKDAMPTWSAPIVPPDEQERFAESVRPMLARMDALSEESARLVALRDALLPEILSGRVRVPVEGVVP